jgi:hypothetical protein
VVRPHEYLRRWCPAREELLAPLLNEVQDLRTRLERVAPAQLLGALDDVAQLVHDLVGGERLLQPRPAVLDQCFNQRRRQVHHAEVLVRDALAQQVHDFLVPAAATHHVQQCESNVQQHKVTA